MKHFFIGVISGLLTLSNINIASASNTPMHLPFESISTSNILTITQNSIMNGQMFDEMSYTIMSDTMMSSDFTSNTIWWSNLEGMINMDLGNLFMVQDVLMQVDANDAYQMDYSIDNINWDNLFTINPDDGEIARAMDTMSSDNLNEEYVANMDFAMVEARYLRLSASGGNGLYILSEVQVFGSPLVESNLQTVSSVPNPPTFMLFGVGLVMLLGLQHRRKKLLLKFNT
ncbi:MAG: hypothetical protein L3J38_01110 [Thiomicrorhabdus sp.]|nr:hypothetical protein [Thiomicrorhabdus sp.]